MSEDREFTSHNERKIKKMGKDHEFLKDNKHFIVDDMLDSKLILSVGPSGYLFCVKS